MKIQVDGEGKQAVIQLCDLALKQSGVQNVQAIVKIMASIKELPADEHEAERPKDEDSPSDD